jgi:hypothetical protein
MRGDWTGGAPMTWPLLQIKRASVGLAPLLALMYA